MTKYGLASTFGLALVLSLGGQSAFAGGFFHSLFHSDECCDSYSQCCQCGQFCRCEEEEDDDEDHPCCLCPPFPPEVQIAFSMPIEIDFTQPIADEQPITPQAKDKEPKTLEERMAELEQNLARLTVDVKALTEAMKRVKPEAISN